MIKNSLEIQAVYCRAINVTLVVCGLYFINLFLTLKKMFAWNKQQLADVVYDHYSTALEYSDTFLRT
ncbi:hypothetical protein, partial [Acinetobacter baumannii]|uniref:hypothetical protein n=1 Tax=Acinetobacter baumannii TaxID=470 RepID=UPI00197A8242